MNRASRWTGVASVAALVGSLAHGQATKRASVDSAGAEGDAHSLLPSLSADGRYVAFESQASNLVADDTSGWVDVFVRDLRGGATERVSVGSSGAPGNSASLDPSISADGRFVAFESSASNLVDGDANGIADVFVRDRLSGTTALESVATGGARGNGQSFHPSISADGRFVAFASDASSLVDGDTNAAADVFVRDREAGTTQRVSVATGGSQGDFASSSPSISADGRFVAFESRATNLVDGDTNGLIDLFVRDRLAGTTERVSVAAGGAQADGGSEHPSISSDGRVVAFESLASNLVAGDTDGWPDVFVHDRRTGTTERVSVAADGTQGNLLSSLYISSSVISADGRFVTFASEASNLVPGDTNTSWDVFLRDRQRGSIERVSLAADGGESNEWSTHPSISADGRYLAFYSVATDLVAADSNASFDVFVRDRGPLPIEASCFGDGTGASCPCGNSGHAGRGCENSSSTGGALLTATGNSSLSSDTLVLTSSGETPRALSIFLQGTARVPPLVYGDGLRCAGGSLERLYVLNASGGVASAPAAGLPAVSARSAALNDPIPMGATRQYQIYYRDPRLVFCPSPLGNAWNISNALSAVWSP